MGREYPCKQVSLLCVGSARGVRPHWVCPRSRWWRVLSPSTLPRPQVALQGSCLKQALGCVRFPGLSRSGSGPQILHGGTAPVGPAGFVPFPARSSSGNRGLGERAPPGVRCVLSPPRPSRWVSRVHSDGAISGVLCASSGELISDCDPPGGCQPPRIPGRLGQQLEPAHSLVEDAVSGAEIASCLPAPESPACLSAPQPASSPLVFAQCFVLCALELFVGKFSLSLSLAVLQFGLLSHLSSLRLSSEHLGRVLTPSNAAGASLLACCRRT